MKSLEAGATVGRYRLIRRLGAGAMGEVFLAEDPTIGRRVAVKTVRFGGPGQSDSAERTARLLREAQAAGRLLHPNVVTLFDAGEQDGWVWLAFEFVDGATLGQRMAVQPALTLAEILRLVREAAQGLVVAHEQGIVHRDIKPSNILLDAGGRAKVADFGIARVAGETTELTATGSVVGSPFYLAPEQVRGEALDGRNDLFSLGVVFYELLTGERPWPGETLTTLVYQILNQEPRQLRELCPGIPPAVERVLDRMLAKEPDDRWPTARALVGALEHLESSLADRLLARPPRELPGASAGTEIATAPTRLLPRPGVPATTAAPVPGSAREAAASPRRPRWLPWLLILAVVLALWVVAGNSRRGRQDPGDRFVPPPEELMSLAAEASAEGSGAEPAVAGNEDGEVVPEAAAGPIASPQEEAVISLPPTTQSDGLETEELQESPPPPIVRRERGRWIEVRQGVELEVFPPRAGIFVDGKFMGAAVKFLGRRRQNAFGTVSLEPGEHRLAVRAPGYLPQEIRVLVHEQAAEQRLRVVLHLERRPGTPRRP